MACFHEPILLGQWISAIYVVERDCGAGFNWTTVKTLRLIVMNYVYYNELHCNELHTL
jgi:hypothetical protein